MNLITIVLNFFNSIINKVITQDFKLEGYEYLCDIPFTSCDMWVKGIRPMIRYRGEKWELNRDEFMIEKHGMTIAELNKPENALKLVLRNYMYEGRTV